MDYQLGPGPLQVDQNTIDEKIKGDIGIVENGDVATHAIPSGYYVIWKGDLYVAKTDISSGTTLSAASNGNLTAKPSGLGAEVAALNGKLNSGANSTNDILASALACTETKFFFGAGSNYTGSIPDVNYGYGTFIVNVRGANRYIIASSPTNKIAINSYDGDSWKGWQELATNSNFISSSQTLSTDATGNVGVSRYGRLRIMYFINVTITGDITITNLSSRDQCASEADGAFVSPDGATARVWLRPNSNSIGVAVSVSGKSYTGQIIYIAKE